MSASAAVPARGGQRAAFARLLSSAVGSQALLSAASFAVGLMLILRTSDAQYGLYILMANVVLLTVSLQSAFFGPVLAMRMARLDATGRGALAGALQRVQRHLLVAALAVLAVAVPGLWAFGQLATPQVSWVLVGFAAVVAVLRREYFRIVLFAQQRPQTVLRADAVHVAVLLAGVFCATLTPMPALAALAALGIAAVGSSWQLARALHTSEGWSSTGAAHLLREVGPLAAWSTAGAAVHWAFSHGYMYLVAGTLDVTAVAAIAATRLLLMPVNLLSSGLGPLMLPLASTWLLRHGSTRLLHRLAGFAFALAVLTLGYFALLWGGRDWVFAHVLRKQFAHGDALLLLWGVLMLVMVVRDQFAYLPAAQGRFRALMLLTLLCAVVALTASQAGMRRYGVPGALMGLLVGECISVAGVLLLTLRRSKPLAAHGGKMPLPQPARCQD